MKTYHLIIAALFTTSFFLAGCGGGDPAAPAPTPEVTKEPAKESTKAATPTKTPVKTPAKAPAPAKAKEPAKAASTATDPDMGTADAKLDIKGKTADFNKCFAYLDKRNKNVGPRLRVTFFKDPAPKFIEFYKKTGFAPPAGPACSLTFSLKKEAETLDASNLSSFTFSIAQLLETDMSIANTVPGDEIKTLSGKLAAGERVKGHVDYKGCNTTFDAVIFKVEE